MSAGMVILVLGVLSLGSENPQDQATRAAAQQAPHERPPTGSWIPSPPNVAGGFRERCCPWGRDGYDSIQVNVDSRGCNRPGDAANEPSIAIDPKDPRKMVIGWRQFDSIESDFRQAGYAYSHDGGRTWVSPGTLTPGVFGSDPVLAANADGVVFYLSINFEELRLFRSFDGGVTWGNRIQVVDSFIDKPWMTIDRTDSIGRDNIYICGWYRSTDEGQSFAPISIGANCMGGTVAVGRDGTVYAVDGPALKNDRLWFRWSVNAADPLEAPVFDFSQRVVIQGQGAPEGLPNYGGLTGQVWIDVDRTDGEFSGRIYLLSLIGTDMETSYGLADPADLVLRTSDDRGETWSTQVKINDDPLDPGAWQWFNTLSVAPNGRVDVVWNDTRHSLQPQLSELFYSYSLDGGVTWSPNVPVSPVFDSWVGWPGPNNKLGDYYHMVSDNLGVNVAYAATFNGEQDIYFLRIGPWDCNGNEIDDAEDISGSASLDCNANEVPDECEYRADLDGDGLTTVRDHAAFASALTGPASSINRQSPIGNRQCESLLDVDHDGDIDLADFYGLQRVMTTP